MARYPYTQAMYQAGILPYALSGLEMAGMALQNVPEAFVRGIDIARVLQHEEWQRQQYEQQMKYTQAANLVNTIWQLAQAGANLDKLAESITPQQQEAIRQVFNIDIKQMLASIPRIKDILRNVDFSIVGPDVASQSYWFANYYTTLPGEALKDILGDTYKTPTGEEIKIDPNRLYLLPAGYQVLWAKRAQLQQNLEKFGKQLQLYRDKLLKDEKIKAIQTFLKVIDEFFKMGEFDKARMSLIQNIVSIIEVLKEKGLDVYINPMDLIEEQDMNVFMRLWEILRNFFDSETQKKSELKPTGKNQSSQTGFSNTPSTNSNLFNVGTSTPTPSGYSNIISSGVIVTQQQNKQR